LFIGNDQDLAIFKELPHFTAAVVFTKRGDGNLRALIE
jgi:hypothetical protein